MKNTLFFSVSLLLTVPALQAMEKPQQEELKFVDAPEAPQVIHITEPEITLTFQQPQAPEKPAKWYNKVGKKELAIGGAVTAVAGTGIAAASSKSVRGFLKSWTVDPIYNKYQAIKKNGMQELMKPTLGTAALATAGYFGYKWWTDPAEQDTTKRERALALWQNHKKKILFGAGAAVGAALLYKLTQSSEVTAELGVVNPKLKAWCDGIFKGLSEAQKKTLAPQLLEIAQAVPSLFIIDKLGDEYSQFIKPVEKELALEVLAATKRFVALLNKEQKAELLKLVQENNHALVKEYKKQLMDMHQKDMAVRKQLAEAKTAKELLTLIETKAAKDALGKLPTNDKERIESHVGMIRLQLIYCASFEAQEQAFAERLKKESSSVKNKEAASKEERTIVEEIPYAEFFRAFEESLSTKQKEEITKHNLNELVTKAQKDKKALVSLLNNEHFMQLLNEEQLNIAFMLAA